MGFAAAGKLLMYLMWPVIFLLIFYFKDKKKFKADLRRYLGKNDEPQ